MMNKIDIGIKDVVAKKAQWDIKHDMINDWEDKYELCSNFSINIPLASLHDTSIIKLKEDINKYMKIGIVAKIQLKGVLVFKDEKGKRHYSIKRKIRSITSYNQLVSPI